MYYYNRPMDHSVTLSLVAAPIITRGMLRRRRDDFTGASFGAVNARYIQDVNDER